ncbi:MAG: tyrosine-type recombinase/integrase [Bacillus sp. (in: firmicutes)]
MEYVEPIKDVESIDAIKEVLKKKSQRDLLLFVFGINTGIRGHDLLSLKVGDVRDETGQKEFLCIKDEQEIFMYYLNSRIQTELGAYLAKHPLEDDDYLFMSKKKGHPITRQQAYRIINTAAKEVGICGKIGMHTLRKTFGYHAYRKGIAISILMETYKHSSPSETLKYIGIKEEDKRLVKVDVNL